MLKSQSLLINSIIVCYAICFLIGGLSHWYDISNNGILPYKDLPLILNVYLTGLAVFDLVIAILMFIRPVFGVCLSIIVMLSDLFVDFYANHYYWHTNLTNNSRFQLLLVFGMFVFVSAPLLITRLKLNSGIKNRAD